MRDSSQNCLTWPLLNSWPQKPSEILKNHFCCFKPLTFGLMCYTATDNWFSSLSGKMKNLTRVCPWTDGCPTYRQKENLWLSLRAGWLRFSFICFCCCYLLTFTYSFLCAGTVIPNNPLKHLLFYCHCASEETKEQLNNCQNLKTIHRRSFQRYSLILGPCF